MPYVTEQLRFNLGTNDAVTSNKPVTQQPSPMLLNNFVTTAVELSSMNSMDQAVLLARRDIRLGNIPMSAHDDLDLVPVKEAREEMASFKNPSKRAMLPYASFAPTTPIVRQNHVARIIKPHIQMPSNIKKVSPGESQRNISTMIQNLAHAYQSLGKTSSKTAYPDVIEEDRLQRRVEEQRRHLYRMLYNTKRHICQLSAFLERTAFSLRESVLGQSSILCHVSTAYRSLMSALDSFIRVSDTMRSTYMTDLKQKVRTEIKVLLDELDTVCKLLQLQNVPIEPVEPPQLKILNMKKCEASTPLSPERDESLRAAVRSLVKSSLAEQLQQPIHNRSTSPLPQHKNIHIKKDMPNKGTKKKFIKPKSSVQKKKRPVTAAVATKQRPLGTIDQPDTQYMRPGSAPTSSTPLHICGGQLTPFITERELARQAWLDKLDERQPVHDYLGTVNTVRAPSPSLQSTPREQTSPHLSPRGELPHVELGPVVPRDTTSCDMSTTMVQLLSRLEELEKEEEEIRTRWLHVQYSDPYKKDNGKTASVVLPSAALLAPIVNEIVMSHDTCTGTGLADIKLSRDTINSIECYCDSRKQYLRLIKHHKTKDFNPWATINNLVDDIVNSVVDDVCTELLRNCDDLAENMYMSEFLPVT